MMTDGDRSHAVYEHVFGRADMARIVQVLASSDLTRTRAGARHILSVPAVQDLADDARLIEIAAQFVGWEAVPFRATLFDKSSSSNWLVVWHQDTALPLRCRVADDEWGPWSAKAGLLYAHAPAWALDTVVAVRVHLDDSTAANGPLRVLPGSHRLGVMSDEAIEGLARVTAAVDCLADAGGVVAMRPLTVHASSKSTDGKPRRVLHIEYAARLTLGAEIELAVG